MQQAAVRDCGACMGQRGHGRCAVGVWENGMILMWLSGTIECRRNFCGDALGGRQ